MKRILILIVILCLLVGCESMMVTANGEIIHSGHVNYDQPLYPFT